jgi:hypothetical protein
VKHNIYLGFEDGRVKKFSSKNRTLKLDLKSKDVASPITVMKFTTNGKWLLIAGKCGLLQQYSSETDKKFCDYKMDRENDV